MLDFHTHRLDAPSPAIVSLPAEVLLHAERFAPRAGIGYAVGVHPWWTEGNTDALWQGVQVLARHPQVVMIGEAGFDTLRGDEQEQMRLFRQHIALAEELQKPMVIHCVRAFHLLLAEHKAARPQQRWIVHGFRGKPALASQLLSAGMDLSFGPHCHAESLRLPPLDRLHIETDDHSATLPDVYRHLLAMRPDLCEKDFLHETEIFLHRYLVN